jgi:hypothetical protein
MFFLKTAFAVDVGADCQRKAAAVGHSAPVFASGLKVNSKEI